MPPRAPHDDADTFSADSQIVVPPSFVALFVPPGRIKPTAPRAVIAQRHEFCDDLAQLLMEPARTQQFSLGITELDVLERMHAGLLGDAAVVSADEARWVVCRLAELLDWPQLFGAGAAPGVGPA
ncbi:ATPase with chaperone activity [Rubrivivax sp. RP6-9]|uniref:ATPase with chaperone activity n=1 Tax=Rubrivivax sp. RP6-9 TaxID=3415750 RepID=UPI003CC5F658